MKEFRNLKTGTKTISDVTKKIYIYFLLMTLFSYLIMIFLSVSRSSYNITDVSNYYKGNISNEIYGKSYGELLELTHFHIFSIPVILLILTHVYALIFKNGKLSKLVVYGSFISSTIYIFSPWLIKYLSVNFSYLFLLSRILFGACLLELTIHPLIILVLDSKKRSI